MAIIKAIIIENEPKPKAMLVALLQKFCPQVELLGDASNLQDGVTLIYQTQPDLVFLDIEMPEEKGTQLFDYFEEINFEVIFTTAYDQYAINALRLSALDYLLKPIDLKELRLSIAQFNKKRQKKALYQSFQQQLNSKQINKVQRIVLPTKESFVFLNLEEVMYIQIESGYTTFIDKHRKKHLVAKPIKDYNDLLEKVGFLRVHRGAIANPHYISKIIRTRPSSLVMQDGTIIPIAKSRRDFLITELTKL